MKRKAFSVLASLGLLVLAVQGHSQGTAAHQSALYTASASIASGPPGNLTSAMPGVVQAGPVPNSITYIGNAGFLIWTGDKKILVDAVFDGRSPAYTLPVAVKEAVVSGQAPFDNIDLVLVTHSHGDHFSAAPVRRVLENNPRAIFVGTADAVASLTGMADRAIALDVPEGQRQTREVNGIRIDAMAISHGIPPAGRRSIVNLGYLMTVGGLKFLHTGDVDVQVHGADYLTALGLPGERIDVAFVQHFYLSTPAPNAFVTTGIQPRFIIVSHLQYTDEAPNYPQILRNFPDAVVLRTELDSWPLRNRQ